MSARNAPPVVATYFFEGGIEIARVPLSGAHAQGEPFELYREHWDAVVALGLPTNWLRGAWKNRYVVTRTAAGWGLTGQKTPGGQLAYLHRIITKWICRMDVELGDIVSFRDGNPLNLRLSNLKLLKGKKAQEFKEPFVAATKAKARRQRSNKGK